MIGIMSRQVETFRIARRLGSKSRGSLYGLNEVPAMADDYGIGISSHPGMVAVDLVFGREVADLQERHRRITKGHTKDAVMALQRSRRTTLDRFMELSLNGRFGIYEIGEGEIVLGAQVGRMDEEILIEERKLGGICLATAARVGTSELGLGDAEQFLTLGLIYNKPSEDGLDEFIAHLEEKFPLPDQVGLFDVTVRDATITRH